jgi:hypothetical protein
MVRKGNLSFLTGALVPGKTGLAAEKLEIPASNRENKRAARKRDRTGEEP